MNPPQRRDSHTGQITSVPYVQHSSLRMNQNMRICGVVLSTHGLGFHSNSCFSFSCSDLPHRLWALVRSRKCHTSKGQVHISRHWASIISMAVLICLLAFIWKSMHPGRQGKRAAVQGLNTPLECTTKGKAAHIYIYEYILCSASPLVGSENIQKKKRNDHSKGGKKERGEILCYSWAKLLLTLRVKKKKNVSTF